jgi:ATP-dependent Clp protease protease subunit
MARISERQLRELITAVEDVVRREAYDRQREYYFVDDIDKESVKRAIEGLRGFAYQGSTPITLYLNTPGGNVTDGLALYDAIRQLVGRGIEVSIIVQGMAYSMGSVVLQAASPGRRFVFPHSWIMIHEPAKWAGWQSTSSAAQHLDRLKAMQAQIYRILSDRSGLPLKQIIRDTKRTDFYLDAENALSYGLVDAIVGRESETETRPAAPGLGAEPAVADDRPAADDATLEPRREVRLRIAMKPATAAAAARAPRTSKVPASRPEQAPDAPDTGDTTPKNR